MNDRNPDSDPLDEERPRDSEYEKLAESAGLRPGTDLRPDGGQATPTATTDLESCLGGFVDERIEKRTDGGGGGVSSPGEITVGQTGCDFTTIAQAFSAASDGDSIIVTGTYDAQAAGESIPINLDYREKEVELRGLHPSRSVIDGGDANEPVVRILGAGPSDYRNNSLVSNLRITGGTVGMKVYGAPFSGFYNLIFHQTGSHGLELCPREYDGESYGTFGATIINCQAWGCGDHGFRLQTQGNTHDTTLLGCLANACGGHGFALRGTSVKILGGCSQLNHGFGVEVRNNQSCTVRDVYIEGNARAQDFPVEIYATHAHNLLVEGCYLHGINPRGASHEYRRVQRGINVHDSRHVTVRDNTFRRYGEGGTALFGCEDAEVALHSHELNECPFWAVPHTNAVRTRSNGVILPQDLSQVEGQRLFDVGIHQAGNATAWAVWLDGGWQLMPAMSFDEWPSASPTA